MAAAQGRLPVGIVMGVVVVELPLLRNSMANARIDLGPVVAAQPNMEHHVVDFCAH